MNKTLQLTGLFAMAFGALAGSADAAKVNEANHRGVEATGLKPEVSAMIQADPARVVTPLGIIRPEALPLQVDLAKLARINASHHRGGVILRDFPLEPGLMVDLDLQPWEVLAPQARIVLMERGADGKVHERVLPRPTSTLWVGHVVGEPDSSVFLGLSERGCHGLIECSFGSHILSSPPLGDGPPTIYPVGDAPGQLQLSGNTFQCHIEDLRGQPHGPQVVEDLFDHAPNVNALGPATILSLDDFEGGRVPRRQPPSQSLPDGGTERSAANSNVSAYSGACCIGSIGSYDTLGQCLDLPINECEDAHGIYLGHNTNCSTLGGDEGGDEACSNEPLDCFRVRIAIETDVELLANRFGGDVDACLNYIHVLVGASSQIFDRDLSVRLQIPFVRLWAEDTNQIDEPFEGSEWVSDAEFEPWTATNTSGQLNQVKAYWQSGAAPFVERDLLHMLCGRHLGGGIAYLSAVCAQHGYAVSAGLGGVFPYPLVDFNGQNWDINVFTHETGHNLGTGHTHSYLYGPDGNAIDSCASNCGFPKNYPATIMSYCHICPGGMANIMLHFHPYTRGRMYNFLRTLNCAWVQQQGDLLAVDDLTSTYPGLPVTIDVTRNDRGYLCDNDNVTIDPTLLEPFSLLGGVVELVEHSPDESDPWEHIQYTSPCGLGGSGLFTDHFSYTLLPNQPDAPDGMNDNATVRIRVLAPVTDPNAYLIPIDNIFSVGPLFHEDNLHRIINVPPSARIIAVGWDDVELDSFNGSPFTDSRWALDFVDIDGVSRRLDVQPYDNNDSQPGDRICGAERLDGDPLDPWYAPESGEIFVEFFEANDNGPGADAVWFSGDLYIVVDAGFTSAGACCVDTLCTNTDSASDCDSLGGVFQGSGTICNAQSCMQQEIIGGACCISIGDPPEVVCSITTQAICESQEGEYQGDNSECLNQTCAIDAPPEGACCLLIDDGPVCGLLTEVECVLQAGEYQGDGILCEVFTCEEEDPSGACCLDSGSCIELPQTVCLTGGAIFMGAGVACDDINCEILTGACCVSDSFCQDMFEADCDEVSGEFMGVGSVCQLGTCTPSPTGACCLWGTVCVDEISEEVCGGNGGVWHEGTTCFSALCTIPGLGACCFGQFCLQRDEAGCAAIDGTFHGAGTSCSSDLCLTGACCLGEICLMGTEFACETVVGAFQGYGLACENANCEGCPPDIDGDGDVDVDDLLILILEFGNAGGQADVNGDGVVDVNDVLLLIANWGGDGC